MYRRCITPGGQGTKDNKWGRFRIFLYKFRAALLASTGFVVMATLPAFAQGISAADSVVLEEIVITATKRAAGENEQKVPIAITAFGAEQLAEKHVQSIHDLSYSAPKIGRAHV